MVVHSVALSRVIGIVLICVVVALLFAHSVVVLIGFFVAHGGLRSGEGEGGCLDNSFPDRVGAKVSHKLVGFQW